MQLKDHLPRHIYSDEEHVTDLQDAVGRELDAARSARDDLLLQARPATATWGLDRYEREYGIRHDGSKGDRERLAHWRAKKRGRGTTTKALIERVAGSYTNGEVEVREYPGDYRFTVTFKSALGIPPCLDSLKELIEELKPAHLAVDYLIRYNTHRFRAQFAQRQTGGYTHRELRELEVWFTTHHQTKDYTHERLAQSTHTEIRLEGANYNGHRWVRDYTHDRLSQHTHTEIRQEDI